MNTSSGPVVVDPTPHKHVNTSRVVEEDLTYTDEEAEITTVMPAGDWKALVGDEVVALVAFVALDDGRMHGVVVGDDGRVDLTENNVETYAGFTGYKQANTSDREN
jgi:hypothetical protein